MHCCPHRAASYFWPDISTSSYVFVNSSQAPLRRKPAIGEFMFDRLESAIAHNLLFEYIR